MNEVRLANWNDIQARRKARLVLGFPDNEFSLNENGQIICTLCHILLMNFHHALQHSHSEDHLAILEEGRQLFNLKESKLFKPDSGSDSSEFVNEDEVFEKVEIIDDFDKKYAEFTKEIEQANVGVDSVKIDKENDDLNFEEDEEDSIISNDEYLPNPLNSTFLRKCIESDVSQKINENEKDTKNKDVEEISDDEWRLQK